MFKKEADMDPENVGIMSGFKDMEEDMPAQMLALMGVEDDSDDSDESEDDDDAKEKMERSPASPEILMNNLRGDMRSIDARKEELADLVGYRAASETPDEVLALLQPVLAQQGTMAAPEMSMPMGAPMPAGSPQAAVPPVAAGGIGALPQGMPQEAPMPMAQGGMVQRFRDGSDEDAVTPSEGSAPGMSFPPEMVSRAQTEIMNFLAQKPAVEPSLTQQMALRKPLYKSILGDTTNLTQGQILFDIAQGAFQYGANVDEQGRPLRGSQAARLMSSFRGVPGRIAARAGELEKQQRAVDLAALQAAEKDIANIRATNAKLIESQRRIFSDVVKAGGSSVFGKGDWEWGVINRPGLLSRWVQGRTTDQENNLIDSAITEFKTPIIENRVDPVTKEPYTVQRNRLIPPFLQQAIEAKSGTTSAAPTTGQGTPTTGQAVPVTAPTGTTPAAAPAGMTPTSGQAAPAAVVGPTATLPQRPVGLYGLAPKIAGPGAAVARGISGVPGLGDPFPEVTIAIKEGQLAVEDLIETSLKSRSGAINEQNRLRSIFGLGPRPFTDPELYKSEVVAIDNILAERLKKEQADSYDNNLPPDVRGNAREMVKKITELRSRFVLPPRIYSADDQVYKGLQPGQEYLWQGVYPMKKGSGRGR